MFHNYHIYGATNLSKVASTKSSALTKNNRPSHQVGTTQAANHGGDDGDSGAGGAWGAAAALRRETWRISVCLGEPSVLDKKRWHFLLLH